MQLTIDVIKDATAVLQGKAVSFESYLNFVSGDKLERELLDDEKDAKLSEYFEAIENDHMCEDYDGRIIIGDCDYAYAIFDGFLLVFYCEYVKDENGDDTEEVDLAAVKIFKFEG